MLLSREQIPDDLMEFFEPADCGYCYVCHMVEVFREVRRVLRPDATLWLNLADSYAQTRNSGGIKPKDLVGIPWMTAFALRADGWWLRSDIIWAKTSCLPESCTDRPTRSHEHVFLLTKSANYEYDADAIREESEPEQRAHNLRYAREYSAHTDRAPSSGQPGNVNNVGIHSRPGRDGRNKRDVWRISPTPYPEAHFAAFPEALVEPCVLAGAPVQSVVLDPFAGSGTTLAVAKRLDRRAIGIELNPAYVPLIAKRCRAEGSQIALDMADAI